MRRKLFGRVYVWEQYVESPLFIVIILAIILVPALAGVRHAAQRAQERVHQGATKQDLHKREVIEGISSMATRNESGSYLLRVVRALELCRGDIPAMQSAAEKAAKRLAGGGRFFAAGQPSMVSELCGRAGGFMMLKSLTDLTDVRSGDVVLYTPEPGVAAPGPLHDSGAYVVVFGGNGAQTAWPCFANHAAETYISPTLANVIPAWLFTGELVAALTRLGKMPVMFESIGAYGGNARIAQYKNGAIAWHESHTVPRMAHGVIGNRFLDIVKGMLNRVEAEERADIDQAGAWAAEAYAHGKHLYVFSMGHLFPDEVGKTDIGKYFHSDVWNTGFRTSPPPPVTFAPGDAVVHIGYQHPASEILRIARPAGARVAYVTVMRDRDYVNDPEVVWIDPMWPWADAVVPLDGYDVPLLAASGIVNGAIAWDIYRVTMEHIKAE